MGTTLAQQILKAKFEDTTAKHGKPPAPVAGGERCLTWHLRPHCFTNCCWAADHVLLWGQEKEELHTWCQKAFLDPEWDQQQRRPHPGVTVPSLKASAVQPALNSMTPSFVARPPTATPTVVRQVVRSKSEPKHPELVSVDKESGEPLKTSSLNPSVAPHTPKLLACSTASPRTACSLAQLPACAAAQARLDFQNATLPGLDVVSSPHRQHYGPTNQPPGQLD